MEAKMLHLIDILEKDRQAIEGNMLRIMAEIKTLQAEYKSLDASRENVIYVINQLEEASDG
jgi:hypothetical protein